MQRSQYLKRHWFIVALLLACGLICGSALAENANRFVHDPCIIQEGEYYYLFCTGGGIPIRRSKDLVQWEQVGRVFQENVPAWAAQAIPGSKGIWAPDVSFFNNRFQVYYAVSTIGKNRSVIGVVTNKTLDPDSKDYRWVDEGKVIESFPNNDFNAIDPNLVFVAPGKLALVLGSFWTGIKLVALDSITGKPLPDVPLVSVAQRPSTAIEAPFIIHRGDYYYLFVSFDACCQGTRSTYNIRVGRARDVTGPYLDHDGKSMMQGGGSLVLGTQDNMIGPGHCAVLQSVKGDFLVYHFYDGTANGVPTLGVRPLSWTPDGWPVALAPLGS